MPRLKVIQSNNLESAVVEVPSNLALVLLEELFTFGCKAGACGKCQVEIIKGQEDLAQPNAREARGLKLFAPGEPSIRLACQLKIIKNCEIKLRGKK